MEFEHRSRKSLYNGVSFRSVRTALFFMYFYYDGMAKEEADTCFGYVLPMQHNITNPLQGASAKDTFIEFWIAKDDRVSQDITRRGYDEGDTGENNAHKLATVDIRFVGAEAETWAKAFHHISSRERVAAIFELYCNGRVLEYIGPIIPVNIDYFGVGNSSIAFDLTVKIEYNECIKLDWKPLKLIVMAPGEVETEGEVQV